MDEPENVTLYKTHVKKVVMSALEGINGTVFAYGQTGSGKTHTIMGTRAYPGVVALAVSDMFAAFRSPTCTCDYTVKVRKFAARRGEFTAARGNSWSRGGAAARPSARPQRAPAVWRARSQGAAS